MVVSVLHVHAFFLWAPGLPSLCFLTWLRQTLWGGAEAPGGRSLLLPLPSRKKERERERERARERERERERASEREREREPFLVGDVLAEVKKALQALVQPNTGGTMWS